MVFQNHIEPIPMYLLKATSHNMVLNCHLNTKVQSDHLLADTDFEILLALTLLLKAMVAAGRGCVDIG